MNEEAIEQKITLSSKKKWFWLGLAIAVLNPIFSGLVLGIAFLTEPQLKKEGKIILALAIIWGIAVMYLSRWLAGQGILNI
ncbi:MAG: hypothetical protein A3I88_01370 [Candidatus Portnoybacteria bacterium RIFCSPLOWO2_12_FULL_39_9]|uniref:Uncharacterized protein n=1 Tax=Candidatus Portnoybacteria bacterium RIFCSPHIGHO2_12_FULL_38_9 TaxID=1801997 RepID=A0A1G2FHF7_9BACT|nr:MAG: hypothetical protein A3H00_01445 [Candidatus Portnoybacteria bacterium RBG_13_40_8]OGZ36630.1 MAG: hypothetical protein A2646_00430 [Candidatus Portnoybacteria bacterium RIFCSPHIGHO2_02_FULL_39_12]OGZ37524.1 MAG: hypothetical protein A3J64_00855 [Candidatus Portnoybacteria bacterium RIFCSPHIGHO2_12_FULL_38_9]OGZ39356.1 MAG: hypothetical protein A3F21_02735 [Candidatus Portnoybacteria bacterium RIFCSPLOWO2_01_FULL_38_39]OGZ39864.1 MAG: hypothetical protein A3I88_01370 [Candidatus Portnoy